MEGREEVRGGERRGGKIKIIVAGGGGKDKGKE